MTNNDSIHESFNMSPNAVEVRLTGGDRAIVAPSFNCPVSQTKAVEPYTPPEEDAMLLPENAAREALYLKDYSYADMWRETKRDPLFLFRYWVYNFFIPGMGFFTEGYILFSNGNLKNLYKQTWPECWKTYQVCNANWVHSVRRGDCCLADTLRLFNTLYAGGLPSNQWYPGRSSCPGLFCRLHRPPPRASH